MRRLLSLLVALLIIFGSVDTAAALRDRTYGTVSVIVTLRAQAGLEDVSNLPRAARIRRTVLRLQRVATRTQARLLDLLDRGRAAGTVHEVSSFWISNAIAVTATPRVVAELAARPEVASVTPDAVVQAPSPVVLAGAPSGPPTTGVARIGAPDLWTIGVTGNGIVVANMDTGVDLGHPDLAGSWRGGSNSWFDPNGEHPSVPFDMNGHGTWTMGVMVGRDGGGSAIGVAPDAHWIAVKIFDDRGAATFSDIHAGFQWLLDPDGVPATPDAPHVVNDSWTIDAAACDLTFQPDLHALRAVGILPVFAAGNTGPQAATSRSPANNPDAFAVGATDATDAVASFSSRGPSSCGEASTIFPEVVAPGVGILTADPFDGWTTASGTSLAAPHVGGALALLLGAFRGLPAATQESALRAAATDLGVVGPDNTYGHGRIDVRAAYEWLSEQQIETPRAWLSISAPGPVTLGPLQGVRDEDVVAFDDGRFVTIFDGSDVGVTGNVDAFSLLDTDSLLLSLDAPTSLPGIGTVDDSDVIRFDGEPIGPETTGVFSMWLDGSDVGLATDSEDVDAVDVRPDGVVILSTTGQAHVFGVKKAEDEDLLSFTPVSLGAVTSGSFAWLFDGSDVGLTTNDEDVDAASIPTDGRIYLSTIGPVVVPGATGGGEDVVVCSPVSLGSQTTCPFAAAPFLDGSLWGLSGAGVDAVELP